MKNIETECINGAIGTGDLVLSSPDDEYACLVGAVIEIQKAGTPEHETENLGDDVHVNFSFADYSAQRKKEIGKMFSDLYEQKMTFADCPIDDVIMPPEALVRITEIDRDMLAGLLNSEKQATEFFREIQEQEDKIMAKKAMENQEMEQKQAQEETAQPAQKTEQELAEERHYLFDAPISELAEHAGVSMDEAVKLRVMAMVKLAPPKMEITVRPVEPQGNLYGFARITVGGITINDFKIVENKDGELFVGMPSRPDGKGGYRSMAYVDKDIREEFNAAVIEEYHTAVERVQARAAALKDKPRMAEQMEKAGKQAAEHNASRPASTKERTAER